VENLPGQGNGAVVVVRLCVRHQRLPLGGGGELTGSWQQQRRDGAPIIVVVSCGVISHDVGDDSSSGGSRRRCRQLRWGRKMEQLPDFHRLKGLRHMHVTLLTAA
jgi:hypothetical protein